MTRGEIAMLFSWLIPDIKSDPYLIPTNLLSSDRNKVVIFKLLCIRFLIRKLPIIRQVSHSEAVEPKMRI